MDDKRVKTSIRVPLGLYREIKAEARSRGISSHAVILETLRGVFKPIVPRRNSKV